MIQSWVLLALISAIFVSMRELYIKRHLKESAEIISLATRFFGSLVLLLLLFNNDLAFRDLKAFLLITAVTAVLTAIATVIRIKLVQTAAISLTTPWLGLVPLFMVFWSAIILKELPGLWAWVGIILVCGGTFTISYQDGSWRLNKAGWLMIGVAAVLGLTTTLDKLAIAASSAFTYTLCWTVLSAFLMLGVVKQKKQPVRIFKRHLIIQAALWVVEFFCQMLAVQYAFSVNSGTTYVKTLTMLNIVITTIVGGIWFKEEAIPRRIIAVLLIFGGAVCLIAFK